MTVGPSVYRGVFMRTQQRTYSLPELHVIRRAWRDYEMGNAINRNTSQVASTVNPAGRNLWNTLRWRVNA